MRVTDEVAIVQEIRKDMRTDPRMYFDVIMRNLDRLEAALSNAAGQEAVAWFVQLDAPGYRDHGTKLGPFSKESEADGWTHRREDGIEWKKVPLYLAQPSTSAEVGRDAVVVIDLQERGILHNAVITGPVKVIAKRIDQVDGNMFQPHGGWKGLSIGASSGREEK